VREQAEGQRVYSTCDHLIFSDEPRPSIWRGNCLNLQN
jgi:hypothetical protein